MIAKYKNFSAKIIAHSVIYIDSEIHELVSFIVKFPRIVLAELNTHRLFSRNSASSRAIPIETMIIKVLTDPFIPDRFPKSHKGMQASEDNWANPGDPEYDVMLTDWLNARNTAVKIVQQMIEHNYSKQLANRILEPFLMHSVIITASELENFFALRTDYAAQNEIKIAADLMLEAYRNSQPKLIEAGEWHLPFGDQLDAERIEEALEIIRAEGKYKVADIDALERMIAVARCARVSYDNFEGKDDYVADVALYHRLKSMGHMSPFEHVARAMSADEYYSYAHTMGTRVEYGWCKNFRGFIQERAMFAPFEENRTFDF